MLLLPLLWFAAVLAQAAEQTHGLAALAAALTEILNNPLALRWCSNTPKFLLAVLVLYPLAVYCYKLDQADRRPGEEHGSAHWGSAAALNAKYRNRKDKEQNYIFSAKIRFSTDSHAHRHNLNVVVIGGSGSGKTRFFVKPNALQASGSYLFLDPKGELVRSLGGFYEQKGIPVTVLDLVHFKGHYNPMHYVESDEDAVKLACVMAMPAFADDPLATINALSDFVFSAIKAIGAILLGFGIVQIGLALKGHDASQRAQGFMTFFGGVVIYFAKDILDMILK